MIVAEQHAGLDVALQRALEAPGELPVERRETHCSWVLLTRDRAYKLKKPVHFGFIDQRTPAARRRGCEEEVRVNAVLAPDVVLGVLGVALTADGCELVDPDAPRAIDWVVEMRRFDEGQTLAALVERRRLPPGAITAVADRIAAFHAATSAYEEPRHAAAVHREVAENIAELVALQRTPREIVNRIARFAEAFVATHRRELDARGRGGMVRDGHGDLRAEHVLLEDDTVTIVDRLEFDPLLRRVDVADDLAFLVMDLRALGADDAADELLRAYRAAGGDPGDDALVAFFAAHRALVRAKVALLRAGQRGPTSVAARLDVGAARHLVSVAERLTWRGRGRHVFLVHGPPASGKTWLAAALAAASGFEVVSTDAVRREVLGVPAGTAAPASSYTTEQRRRVYAEVGRRAAEAFDRGSVIVDGTLGDPAVRGPLFEALAPAADRIVAIECRAPDEVLVRRAAERQERRGELSDAGPDVTRRLAETFRPLGGVPRGQRLVVDTARDPDDLVDRIAAWLDAR